MIIQRERERETQGVLIRNKTQEEIKYNNKQTEIETERDRERDRERGREREAERERQRGRERETERETERQREKEREGRIMRDSSTNGGRRQKPNTETVS